MNEFKRSRLTKKDDEEITKKTVVLGVATILTIILAIVFGLPLIIKLSVLLGEYRSRTDVIKEKVLPPVPPKIITSFEATNTASIRIAGYAEKGVKVELLKNDVSEKVTDVNEDGDFYFDNIPLEKGENTFTVLAADEKRGNSEPSVPFIVDFDDQPPELSMINPSEEKLSVDYADFDLVGKTERNSSVTVNGRIALVDDKGQFKLKFQLSPGKNELEIVIKDLAGNEVKKKIEITYDI